MTDVVAPSSSYFDFQIPSTILWRYGRVRSGPARVPELAPKKPPGFVPQRRGTGAGRRYGPGRFQTSADSRSERAGRTPHRARRS